MKVLIETSARHVHLSREALDVLFGKGYELAEKRGLSQPGQFVSEEKVDIIGPRDAIKKVSILGPLRSKTQVELSMTDARKVGINTVIRESGNLSGSAGCKIVGPNGVYDLKEGVIIAKRHIHMTPEDAKRAGVCDGRIVSIGINESERRAILGDVVVRVSDKFSLACHIDTDESNSTGVKGEYFGEIVLENIF